jgi:3-oxoacyl-[acyl-carrier protein] reductase
MMGECWPARVRPFIGFIFWSSVMSGEAVRVALVTNASDYAGPPAVDALVGAGFHVIVHDRRFEETRTWNQFSQAHPGAEYLPADGPRALIDAAWARTGRVDVIVSNDHHPAVQKATPEVSLADLRETLEALVVSPLALLQAAMPRLREQGGANVVVITSCRTQSPIAGGVVPDAARAASNAMVRSLAVEFAADDIAINAIAPNFLYSEAYYPRAVFIDDPRGRDYVKATVPIQRLARPDEIGEVILFLATTKARFLTGAIIDFSGGWPATAVRPSMTGTSAP